ncbi:50S ribosomal protein L21 [Candidatus Latescibacterota bacterium]
MYAVVEIAGQQVRVDKGQRLRVPKLSLEEGAKERFTDVMLISGEGRTVVGQPHVDGAAVEATVLGHGRGEKVIVFKMKRRKKYRRRNGHRQGFTEIQVDDIVAPN